MTNKIRLFRELIGLTQAELAKQCGWAGSQSRISNYEQGIRIPPLKDARKIVEAFNTNGVDCSIDDVFPPGEEAA